MEILIGEQKVKLSNKVSECIRFHHRIDQPIIIVGGSIRECLTGQSSDGHLDILLAGDNTSVIASYRRKLGEKKFEYMKGISPSLSFLMNRNRVEVIGLMNKEGQLRNIEGKKIDIARQQIIHLTIERMGITSSLEIFDPYHGFEDFQQGILRAIGQDFKRRLSFQKILKFLTLKNQFNFKFESVLNKHIKNFFLKPESYQWGQKLIRACQYYHEHPREMAMLQQLPYHHDSLYQEEYDPRDKLKIGLHLLLFMKRSPDPQKATDELLELGGLFAKDIFKICGIDLRTLLEKIKNN